MQFDLLMQFLAEQWVLVGALATTLFMLFYHESRKAGPSVTTQQAINLVNSEGGVFLDIRDGGEFKKGHIADAINIPLTSLTGRVGELEAHREKPVIVVCRIGQSAAGATKRLREQGFERAQRMTGGMMEWNAQKLPVVSE
ncbi:MAG: rhodanese-like domain-containing protein [Halieaceae bacterium]|nr:rhodanese-like domain-containing protein [Halieaceae bacterium]